MWAFVLVKKLPMQYSLRDHGFFALLALFNFGLNYLVLYWAQNYLTSAMASIAFSMLLLMNIINTPLVFRKANCETNLLWCSARRNGYCKLVLATNSAIRLE